MTTEIISFRLKTEAYLTLEAIAAEEGLSPGRYLKKKLESDTNELIENIHYMKSDVKDIRHILRNHYVYNDSEIEDTKRQQPSDDLLPLVLEALLILREIGAPNKVAIAQKLVNKSGIKAYNSLEG